MKIRFDSNIDEKDGYEERVANFRETIMHPFSHLCAIHQNARNISAGDGCHTSEFLCRPAIKQDKREYKANPDLQREQAREPAGEQRETKMSQQVSYRKVQHHLQDRPERVLSQGKGEDQREDNQAENVIDHCRSQDCRSLFCAEFAQFFQRLSRYTHACGREKCTNEQAYGKRITKGIRKR